MTGLLCVPRTFINDFLTVITRYQQQCVIWSVLPKLKFWWPDPQLVVLRGKLFLRCQLLWWINPLIVDTEQAIWRWGLIQRNRSPEACLWWRCILVKSFPLRTHSAPWWFTLLKPQGQNTINWSLWNRELRQTFSRLTWLSQYFGRVMEIWLTWPFTQREGTWDSTPVILA